jgi:hypothetical protein
MGTTGIEGFLVETHNWGQTVAFWQQLGYELVFETDHHSGQLEHPKGGPFLFVAEKPEGQALDTYPIVASDDCTTFEPPPAGNVESDFEATHWDRMQSMLLDPDGRHVSIQTPVPEGVEAPPGHH